MIQTCAVFAGPSLAPEDRAPYDGVTYCRSAARGDVERAAESFDAILLIDTVFLEQLAPTVREVLHAARTCAFFGAASAGAMRAVECAPYGAVPLGTIAGWFASETIADDEVAVVFDPLTDTPLSVPLVNVRHFVHMAHSTRAATAAECAAMWDAAVKVFYEDRCWEDVVAPVPEMRRGELLSLAERYGDLKRADARTALREVARKMRAPDRRLPLRERRHTRR